MNRFTHLLNNALEHTNKPTDVCLLGAKYFKSFECRIQICNSKCFGTVRFPPRLQWIWLYILFFSADHSPDLPARLGFLFTCLLLWTQINKPHTHFRTWMSKSIILKLYDIITHLGPKVSGCSDIPPVKVEHGSVVYYYSTENNHCNYLPIS